MCQRVLRSRAAEGVGAEESGADQRRPAEANEKTAAAMGNSTRRSPVSRQSKL